MINTPLTLFSHPLHYTPQVGTQVYLSSSPRTQTHTLLLQTKTNIKYLVEKMCWNANVSMNTWLLTLFAAAISYANSYMGLAQTGFFLSFTSMQFIEYLLWSFPKLNSTISAAGYGLIVSQPFFSIFQVTDPTQRNMLLVGYSIFLLYSIYLGLNSLQFKTIVAPNGHLKWLWLPDNMIFMGLYMFLLFAPLYLAGFSNALLGGLAALAVSLWAYHKDGTWGSMWCWFAALFSFWIIGSSLWSAGSCLQNTKRDRL